jgi:hypothetical protein
VIRTVVLYVAVCDVCGAAYDGDAWEGAEVWGESPHEAVSRATGDDLHTAWTAVPDGRLICRRDGRAHEDARALAVPAGQGLLPVPGAAKGGTLGVAL